MSLPTHEDIKLFVDKDIKIRWQQHYSKQHHQKQQKATHLHATNARGRMLKTKRRDKVARSSISTDNESNFGDSSYEVMAQPEGHAKIENGTNKELHVLKQQLRKNMNLH